MSIWAGCNTSLAVEEVSTLALEGCGQICAFADVSGAGQTFSFREVGAIATSSHAFTSGVLSVAVRAGIATSIRCSAIGTTSGTLSANSIVSELTSRASGHTLTVAEEGSCCAFQAGVLIGTIVTAG